MHDAFSIVWNNDISVTLLKSMNLMVITLAFP